MRVESSVSDPVMVAGAGGSVSVKVTPTLTVHATYASGDYVGTSGTPMTFAGMARVPGGSGTILSALLIDAVVASVAAELWLFDTAVTPPADSAAWTVSDADAAHLIAVISFATYFASALNSVACPASLFQNYKCAAGDTALYGCLVTRGAPAYAAVSGDVILVLKAVQD